MSKIALEIEENGPLALTQSVVARAHDRVGSREYRRLFIKRDTPRGFEEVIYAGEFACAYETTAALHNLGLLEATHTTVDGFENEVKNSRSWKKVREACPGAVGILEPKIQLDGSKGTRHTFTCVSRSMAVHNDPDPAVRSPQLVSIEDFLHHTKDPRKVEAYYIHKRLLDEQQ